MELDGHTVLVTGAASGLGRQISRLLAKAGARLGLIDLNSTGADEVLDEVGVPGVALGVDVSDPDEVDRAVSEATERLGSIDILVNNAGVPGVGEPKALHLTSMEEWTRVLAVNATGPFLLTRAAIPGMIERGGGVIVNVASVGGLMALPQRAPYAASKAALVSLTRNTAAEYASYGIRANALCPGWIETPFTSQRLEQPDLRQAVLGSVPMGRIAEVDDIAEAALFLMSRASRYMTGATLVVDGGVTVV